MNRGRAFDHAPQEGARSWTTAYANTATTTATGADDQMAQRIRQVKPELFDDPDLGALPAAVRWLFAGLFTQADRAGRLVDEPRRLKTRLCAYDDTDVDHALAALAAAGFIIRYEVDGKSYIQIRTFTKHQKPHPKEPESNIPRAPEPRPAAADHGEPRKNTASPGLDAREPDFATSQKSEQFRNAAADHGEPRKETASSADSGILDLGSGIWRRVHDDAPRPAASAASPNGRSKHPVFKGSRFVVFDWMLDDLRKLLGRHFETFGLDEWFDRLDRETSGEVVMPQHDGGRWLQARTLEEAQRRGLTVADTSSRPDPLARSILPPGTSNEELAAKLLESLENRR
jgi:hypothetical protein